MLEIIVLAALLQTPAAPPGCTAPEHRQFDFWVGEWVVRGPKGQQAGINRIEKVENGCAIQENWTASNGTTGRSLNFYNPASKTWRQAWAGGGGVLILEGTFDGKQMVLQGESFDPKGARVRDRITWSPLEGGMLRQLWEQSSDGGKTWSIVFDGRYSPAKPAATAGARPPAGAGPTE
jgi:hypothetical protein